VIPGEVQLSLDIRGPQDAPLDRLLAELLENAQAIASRRGLQFSAEEFYRIAATPCDIHLQNVLGRPSNRCRGVHCRCPAARAMMRLPSRNAGR
jgi:allantoate deiminase